MLKRYTERVLAGSVGAAAAGVIVNSYLETRGSTLEEVFDIFGTVTLSRSASQKQLGVLYEAVRIVAGKSELQVIMDEILGQLQRQFKFDICVIRLMDKEGKHLMVRSQKGMSQKHLSQSDREPDLDTYSGSALVTNTVVVVNDSEAIDKPKSAKVALEEGIKSFAHAPIIVEGKPLGVLSAFSKTMKGIFTDEFIELFKNLAGQVGVAVRNAEQIKAVIQSKQHEKEMQIAKSIQLGLLPKCAPRIAGGALGGICIAASEVGGDYYDYLLHGENSVDLIIADVSGHNVGAALTGGVGRMRVVDV